MPGVWIVPLNAFSLPVLFSIGCDSDRLQSKIVDPSTLVGRAREARHIGLVRTHDWKPVITMKKIIITLLFLLLFPLTAAADAIVTNQSMFAETIAEYFVEPGQVRLELEIGEGDITSFRNLLPDAIYQQLGFGEAPLKERLTLFTERTWPCCTTMFRCPGMSPGLVRP